MDKYPLIEALATILVALVTGWKASKAATSKANVEIASAMEAPDKKLSQVIEMQKSEAVRLDRLTERVESLALSFKIHDKAQLEREHVMTRMMNTVQDIAKAQLITAKDQNEIMKTQKVWLDENRVLITSKKKGSSNEG